MLYKNYKPKFSRPQTASMNMSSVSTNLSKSQSQFCSSIMTNKLSKKTNRKSNDTKSYEMSSTKRINMLDLTKHSEGISGISPRFKIDLLASKFF